MQSKLWIWALVLLGIFPTAYLLWQSSLSIDTELADKYQTAEVERHAFVISSDFDLLKENLIEVHRDYWLHRVAIAEQARLTMALLMGMLLLLLLLLLKLWRDASQQGARRAKAAEQE